MGSLRNRRGVIAIFTVLLFLAMLTIIAVVVDFSRMQFMRNQMQTAADGAALAGAVQLLRTPKTDYLTQAKTYAAANTLLGSSIVVNDTDVVLGNWNGSTRVFTAGGSPTTADAVQVTVRHNSSYLMANALGWAPKKIAARSVAWAGPSVSKTNCMKPWAMWYGLLRRAINTYRGIPINSTTDTASLNQDDLQALREMSDAQRTFNLFLGDSTKQTETINSGNFYAVDLPPVQYADGTPGTPLTGGNAYSDALQGVDSNGNPVCYQVGVGDILETEPGQMSGPTRQGVGKGICSGSNGNNGGTCLGPDGTSPLIKSAFWTQSTTKGTGKFDVNVAVIGSFKLLSWDGKGNNVGITGVFQPILDSGPIGTGNTTLQKVVLVK